MSRDEVLGWSLLGLTIGQSGVEVGKVVKVSVTELVVLDGFATNSDLWPPVCGVAILVPQRVAQVVLVLLKQKVRGYTNNNNNTDILYSAITPTKS